MTDVGRGPGPIALVGSGEYLPVMNQTDRALLERVGGPAAARVVVLPTASGLEDLSSPQRWIRLGLDHFKALGARVAAAEILTRDDTHDPRWLPLLEAADMIYFSGGSPQHLVATMAGSPAWDAIRRRYEAGAVLAGCSAGAMAFGGVTAAPGAVRAGHELVWQQALGVLPRLVVLPHFDRMASYVGQDRLKQTVQAVPPGMTLIGVDEHTALVRDMDMDMASQPQPQAQPQGATSSWTVMGSQTVCVFSAVTGDAVVYQAGETVTLEVD